MTEHIRTRTFDHISEIAIDRPDKKNALTTLMYAAITDTLSSGEQTDDVRVHVLTGTESCFTAGNDLKDFEEDPPQGADSPVLQFLECVSTLEKPLVAGVVGPAVGIGTTVLLHCDIVVAGGGSKFQMPFTRLGLCPEAGSSLLLPASAGHRLAAEMLLLGEPFDVARAQEAGLVNHVVPDSDVYETTLDFARKLAALPPSAVRLTKSLLRRASAATVRETIRLEAGHFIKRLQSREAAEAFAAFREKRPPDFSRF